MKKLLCTTIFILCFTAYPSFADQSEKNASIENMLSVIGIDQQMNGGFEAMLPMVDQIAAQLRLDANAKEELKDIYRNWFDNDIDRVAMKSKFIEIYAEAFNEKEINELIAFYQSPIGQKFLKISPELMKLGAKIGMEEGQSKQKQLMERLQPFLEKHKKQ